MYTRSARGLGGRSTLSALDKSEGLIPEWLRFADPLQSKVARCRSLVCHSRLSDGGLGGRFVRV